MAPNKIRPHHRDAHHRNEPRYAFHVAQMGVLDVEARRLHGPKCRFNLPSPLVLGNALLGSVEGDKNLKFGHPGGVFQPASRKVDILALHDEELVVEFLLPELEVVEEPPCPKFLSRTRPDDPEVLFDSDVIADAHDIEPSDPFLADELAIRHEAVDAVSPEKADEAFHQFLALLPIGIATFVEQAEYQRESNALVRHTDHEDIYVEVSELPVCTVHRQNQFVLARQQGENHSGHDVKAERILCDEPLKPAQIGITVKRRRHGGRQLMEAYSLHHTECVEEQRHELYACQIHVIAKMLLHNRKDCVNFDEVLGSCRNFHGKSGQTFL